MAQDPIAALADLGPGHWCGWLSYEAAAWVEPADHWQASDMASLWAAQAIRVEASLSFIGLGVVPPTPEWGSMISSGRYKFYNWWLTAFPGLAMLTVVMGFNFLGDGVRDAFDPHTRDT